MGHTPKDCFLNPENKDKKKPWEEKKQEDKKKKLELTTALAAYATTDSDSD